MSLLWLTDKLEFPDVNMADADGLLAAGGDLSSQRLRLAYRKGIFPWYEGKVILWWSPDPRFVLFPNELLISKSMRPVLRRKDWSFTMNQAFSEVIHHCKTIPRNGQIDTWITDEMENAYLQLHREGVAISAETWENGRLIGGLYGVLTGKVFSGESMFSLKSNASKYAFIHCVKALQKGGVQLIDCQVYTEHLASLGARMIPCDAYLSYLNE